MSKWTGKSYGGYFGHFCFLILIKYCGLIFAYSLLFFVAAHFTIFRRKAYNESARYLKHLGKTNPLLMPFRVYRHNFSFGISIIDKAAYFFGLKKIICKNDCYVEIENLLKDGKGLIVLSAHIGGREIASDTLFAYNVEVSQLLFQNEHEGIAKLFEKNKKIKTPNFIDATKFEAILEVRRRLKNGEIVGMQFDRVVSPPCLTLDFLGSKTMLPTIAYKLAQSSGASIIYTICLREKLYNYRVFSLETVHFSEFEHSDIETLAANKSKNVMFQVAKILQTHNYQWFNFYDYWDTDYVKRSTDSGT